MKYIVKPEWQLKEELAEIKKANIELCQAAIGDIETEGEVIDVFFKNNQWYAKVYFVR